MDTSSLVAELEAAGVKILGTSPHAIQLSEDREEFAKLLKELDIPQPENGIARSIEEAREVAQRIGYPVLVRTSFMLGGEGDGFSGFRSQFGRIHSRGDRSGSWSTDIN